MTLPTAEEVTVYYLYGASDAPNNLIDPGVVNTDVRQSVQVDLLEYMQDGPGRFVTAKSFDFISDFFHPGGATVSSALSALLPAGVYSKSQLFEALGLEDSINYVTFNNVFHGVDDPDYAERTYIWGTVGFAVGSDAVFVVREDGSRSVENFSIVPLQVVIPDKVEDFDFNGGLASYIGNHFLGLYDTIDPSRIGKTVPFEFSNSSFAGVTVDEASFDSMDNPLAMPEISKPEKIWQLTDRLFSAGVTRYLYDDKPIIYGTSGSDTLIGDLANTDAVDFHLGGSWGGAFDGHRQLAPYVKNGIVYVAGDGADTITGTDGSDLMLGNAGNDTLNPGKGFDVLNGGAGSDT